MVRSSVDLPAPDGPRMAVTSPGSMLRLTSSSAVKSPNRFDTPSMVMAPTSRRPLSPQLSFLRGAAATVAAFGAARNSPSSGCCTSRVAPRA